MIWTCVCNALDVGMIWVCFGSMFTSRCAIIALAHYDQRGMEIYFSTYPKGGGVRAESVSLKCLRMRRRNGFGMSSWPSSQDVMRFMRSKYHRH